ncbi:piggyBac transposable element-derived protein 4-like [Bactrocera dorsalis]|uniref:PiggyBac transposable element-derived protein 4-like n=1 Tax=Bactrocera dorsalis TaxID=27457 RepID=A0ABM3JHG5_BACDO|nr:piggyBac transposable element-derived protein 4-like [Bactrocera dorsalis]
MDEVDVLTRLLRKLNAANVSPEERQRLQAQIEEIMGQEDDPFETSGDVEDDEYFPDEDDFGEASDIEQEIELEAVLDENHDDIEDLYREAIALEASTTMESCSTYITQGLIYRSKDGRMWNSNPPPPGRPRCHNVTTFTRKGPLRGASPSHKALFKLLLSPEIVSIIVRETNRKAVEAFRLWNEKHPSNKQRSWVMTDEDEMYAFFGMLLIAGVFHSNSQPAKELWASYNMPIYKATMSLNRFKSLTTFIRFDNSGTRAERLKQSKTAALDDAWLMLMANLEKAYTPDCHVTVDEQLFPYHGRTRFTQYIPSKPAKYGMKVWWICDSVSNYPLKGIIYTGKPPGGQRETNQEMLMNRRVAFVGTVRKNKTFIPHELLNPKRDVKSTLFCYHNNNIGQCSYMAKPKKPVIMLSTAHYRQSTDPLKGFKPDQILDYNKFKAGVDTMDQMLTGYSCKRSTNRWPLAMFYNMLDIAGLASFIIYDELNPAKQSDKRRSFIIELARQLVIPHMTKRATNPLVWRFAHIRQAMNLFNIKVPESCPSTSDATQQHSYAQVDSKRSSC